MADGTASDIPVISITARCLPEAWEKAVLAVWDNGLEIRTQYDKPADKPSRDATVVITVTEPFAEPRIHKNFPGGPAELELRHRSEILEDAGQHFSIVNHNILAELLVAAARCQPRRVYALFQDFIGYGFVLKPPYRPPF
jgi:hypothetical protein